ncbi:hypothetical protein DFJ63DRAFT_174640 [Scheffersomyces coipomensis]|uniref:uncharacterized protein n=1 Tax=Scheffersomyces coipomensis TaxID=1788519 RepID=UPI00315D38E1
MSSFRPYGTEETRVVSDLSRFDFEQVTRSRSRNTTPTSLDEGDDKSSQFTLDNIIPYYNSTQRSDRPQYRYPDQHQQQPSSKTLLQIAEEHPDLYHSKIRPPPPPKDQMGRSKSTKSFSPYPPSVFMSVPYERTKFRDDLPPEMEPTEYINQQQNDNNNNNNIQGIERPNDDLQSINAKSKQLEEDLVRRVMNQPLYTFPGYELGIPKYENRDVMISVNEVVYFIQMIFNIIVIVLASILSNIDHDISAGFYRYFIADSILSLLVCFMFIANIINFEKRNGSFYCLTALLMNLASFIMVLSYIIPKRHCPSTSICNMRYASSSFIIFSTLIWLCEMVVFLTTLYISRLNLLDEINFDFSNQGISRNYNNNQRNLSQDTLIQESTPKELRQRQREREKQQRKEEEMAVKEPPLKEYYLNEKGEMYELSNEQEKEQHKGKNKILVYTF